MNENKEYLSLHFLKSIMLEILNNNNEDINSIIKLDNKNYLTKNMVSELIINKNNLLKSIGLIEINNNVLKLIIKYFSLSSYIDKYNYNEIINELVEVFYTYRTYLSNKISDKQIIEYLYYNFENTCNGVVVLLYDKMMLWK